MHYLNSSLYTTYCNFDNFQMKKIIFSFFKTNLRTTSMFKTLIINFKKKNPTHKDVSQATHHDNTPLYFTPPFAPLLYSKTGYTRVLGIQGYTLFFNYSVWVLVGNVYPQSMHVVSKNKKNITIFHLKFIFFTTVK